MIGAWGASVIWGSVPVTNWSAIFISALCSVVVYGFFETAAMVYVQADSKIIYRRVLFWAFPGGFSFTGFFVAGGTVATATIDGQERVRIEFDPSMYDWPVPALIFVTTLLFCGWCMHGLREMDYPKNGNNA